MGFFRLCSRLFQRRTKPYGQLQRITFNYDALDAWFEARGCSDWEHLAQRIIDHTQETRRKSVYRQHADYTNPPGIRLVGRDGEVAYESDWTLPIMTLHDPLSDRMIHEQTRRLKCLLELVKASHRVYFGLAREDRELLRNYWKSSGERPKEIRKSGIDTTMAKQDQLRDRNERDAKRAADREVEREQKIVARNMRKAVKKAHARDEIQERAERKAKKGQPKLVGKEFGRRYKVRGQVSPVCVKRLPEGEASRKIEKVRAERAEAGLSALQEPNEKRQAYKQRCQEKRGGATREYEGRKSAELKKKRQKQLDEEHVMMQKLSSRAHKIPTEKHSLFRVKNRAWNDKAESQRNLGQLADNAYNIDAYHMPFLVPTMLAVDGGACAAACSQTCPC